MKKVLSIFVFISILIFSIFFMGKHVFQQAQAEDSPTLGINVDIVWPEKRF